MFETSHTYIKGKCPFSEYDNSSTFVLSQMSIIKTKKYHPADVLYGKCDNHPVIVETVQFHGVESTKNDALLKEIGYLYTVSSLPELIRCCDVAAKHLRVGFSKSGLMISMWFS